MWLFFLIQVADHWPLSLLGYVPAWAAVPYGVLGAGCANYATKFKFILGIDDALDIFAVHAIGGLVGNICTAFFATNYIASLGGDPGSAIDGGWLDHNWIQIAYQLAGSFSGGAYSFVCTAVILFVLDLIPGLRIRSSEEAEILGIDDAEVGEFAYDYVEVAREAPVAVEVEPASIVAQDHAASPRGLSNLLPLRDKDERPRPEGAYRILRY